MISETGPAGSARSRTVMAPRSAPVSTGTADWALDEASAAGLGDQLAGRTLRALGELVDAGLVRP